MAMVQAAPSACAQELHPGLTEKLALWLKRPFHKLMTKAIKKMGIEELQDKLWAAGFRTQERKARPASGIVLRLPGGKRINRGTLRRWLHQM